MRARVERRRGKKEGTHPIVFDAIVQEMKYIEVCFSNRMFLPSIPRLLRTIMEKEKEKKMQNVSKLTPEKRKVPCIAIYWQEHFNFFFLVWDKKRVD